MKVLGLRFCTTTSEAKNCSDFFEALGITKRPNDDCQEDKKSNEFSGAIFPAGSSWIEIWQESESMKGGTMLQIVVDDADVFAKHAKDNGLAPEGPIDAHGERIYFIQAPNGLNISFQSELN